MLKNTTLKALGKALFLASIQSSIGSVEMSSKFSVMNFSKDQQTLDRAVAALRSYLVIALVWTIGCTLMLYSNYGKVGLYSGLLFNSVMILWIYVSYARAFNYAAKTHNLKVPSIFSSGAIY